MSGEAVVLTWCSLLSAGQTAEYGQLQITLNIVGTAHHVRVEILPDKDCRAAEQNSEQRTCRDVDCRIGSEQPIARWIEEFRVDPVGQEKRLVFLVAPLVK